MPITIEDLRDTFQIGHVAYRESRAEAAHIWDLYHNRQYTVDQLNILSNRGQPAETFNIVKLFTRMLLGYYSTTVNTVVASPVNYSDIDTATLLNDGISYTLRNNSFKAEAEKIKLSGIIAGLMCAYVEVVDTGTRDEFGRPINKIAIEHVPDAEVIRDPMSKKDDYSDARYVHRFRWISEEAVISKFGTSAVAKLNAYENRLDIDEAEFTYAYGEQFQGIYRLHNNYLIVHSISVDEKGRSWSIFWSADTELSRTEITHKEVKFPYRITLTHTSDRTEYYGVFREVAATQQAINQALIKIQLMVNTHKAYVEDGAVEDIAAFTTAFNRVTAVIPVQSLAGIKIDHMSREVLDQYTIIDKALDRVQRVLGINDSFLGMAFASDSGRKVKLQQNASVVALRYLTGRIEVFYRYLGWDIANLIKQYYTAHQILRIADESVGARWIELNKPAEVWTGKMDAQNQPIMEYEFEEVLDPASGEPMQDDEGNLIFAPIPQEGTEIAFTDVDIEISSTNYNDEDEKNQLMLETVLNGNVGNMLSQVNPAGFFKIAGLNMKSYKTKHAPDIAAILEQTSQMLSGDQEASQQASEMAQGSGGKSPMSSELKLPTNTNE